MENYTSKGGPARLPLRMQFSICHFQFAIFNLPLHLLFAAELLFSGDHSPSFRQSVSRSVRLSFAVTTPFIFGRH